jgi:hypothetical protein
MTGQPAPPEMGGIAPNGAGSSINGESGAVPTTPEIKSPKGGDF